MLIGVCGFAQSGKNSAASILAELDGFKKAAFADVLRAVALGINPAVALNENEPDGFMRYADLVAAVGYEKAKQNPEVRRFLQCLGTEGIRANFGENAWVDALDRQLAPRLASGENIVITDVRFNNEVAYVRRQRGHLWRIVRTGGGPGTVAANDHASETTQLGFDVDYELAAGTLIELQRAVGTAYAITAGKPVIFPHDIVLPGVR